MYISFSHCNYKKNKIWILLSFCYSQFLVTLHFPHSLQWRIQNFPEGEGHQLLALGQESIILRDFSRKLHENKRNCTGGVHNAPLDPPMVWIYFEIIANHLPVSFAVRHHDFLLGRTVLQGVAAFPNVMHSVTVRNPVGWHCRSQVTWLLGCLNQLRRPISHPYS